MEKEELITDEEWQRYIKDSFKNVMYPCVKKEHIERFLTWRKEQKEIQDNGKNT